MTAPKPEREVLSALSSARLVAQLAQEKGVIGRNPSCRKPLHHVGAVLADAALQAGLNYRTVVKVRIDRIVQEFPEASTLSGMFNVISSIGAAEFLRWQHPTKVSRFVCLGELLRSEGVNDFHQLRRWLQHPPCRGKLLAIHGVGPKTADYLCSLVGLDFIAVDRHIRAFANDAGVKSEDYDFLKLVVSYAADLIGVSRRHFDAAIWTYVSSQKGLQAKTALALPLAASIAVA
ncbi:MULTISPECIES: hypothetical protein [unclassified Bradyrhizobium]|jgi:hypothetical protein|uniref:hypothetical protein n=1 Tax=unclassified Bradyrhizobium TaxID=2631580 RepID=UPI000708CE90|nr:MULTISPECIES: hypothetical protein [unclassified Bradyrhizobium]KQT23093.1 hypothetical protein ASG57_25185 [Bradyrhizobium sp. Leaf396]